jgi:LL-H family phage holin
MTIDITQIILAVIGLLAAAVTAVIIPWLRTRLGAERWAQLVLVAQVAVEAAEQLYRGEGKGQEKLTYALERVNEQLRKQGISFDEIDVRAAIEAAVLGLG